jgi:hypothetical protein
MEDELAKVLRPAHGRQAIYKIVEAIAEVENITPREAVAKVTGRKQIYAQRQEHNWRRGRMKLTQAAAVARWTRMETPDYRQDLFSRLRDDHDVARDLTSADRFSNAIVTMQQLEAPADNADHVIRRRG